MSDYEKEYEESGASLVSVLAGDPKILMDGRIDPRITGILRSSEETPDTAFAMFFLGVYNRVVNNDEDLAYAAQDEYLNLTASFNGRGRRDILRGEQVMKGGMVAVESEMQSPGFKDRLFKTRRYRMWEQQQRDELEDL